MSDKIVDEYEEDFEIEESSRVKAQPNKAAAGFGGRNANIHEESSGGYEEKEDEDFF